MTGWWLMAVVCCHLMSMAVGYSVGDTVDVLRRWQYDTWRTEWTESPALSPKFGQDMTVELRPIQTWDVTQELKLSLTFSHERFVSPWIVYADGEGKYLQALTLTFHRSDTDVEDLRVETHYHPPSFALRAAKDLPPVSLSVRWTHTPTSSPATARMVFGWFGLACLSLSFVATAYSLVLADTQRSKPPPPPSPTKAGNKHH